MLYRSKQDLDFIVRQTRNKTEFDPSRWTSDVYEIRFAQVSPFGGEGASEALYRSSGWGMSSNLRSLLSDYTDDMVQQAVEVMTDRQNDMVLDILEEYQYQSIEILPLEQLFIAVETNLFLSKGLRLPVICVTNIVPYGNIASGLDKFVAILDPTETHSYIAERRGTSSVNPGERYH